MNDKGRIAIQKTGRVESMKIVKKKTTNKKINKNNEE